VIIENEKQLALCMEHTLLKADATSQNIKKLCGEAKQYGFFGVCINRKWIELATAELRGTDVKVITPISFPLGADSAKIKATMAKDAIMAGADEIDMVADISAIIESDARALNFEFLSVLKVCRSMTPAVTLKVIIESAALNDDQITFVCQIANNCQVDFIKTSTGFNRSGGADFGDVELIRDVAPQRKIKASGGIKTWQQTKKLLFAGASRIGTSSAVQIIEQYRQEQEK
jgi:deoxyribose-phosphate aldolase